MQRFGEAMASRRTQDDDNARKAIEESAEFQGQPAAFERHQLNTFIPFFREPSMIERGASASPRSRPPTSWTLCSG